MNPNVPRPFTSSHSPLGHTVEGGDNEQRKGPEFAPRGLRYPPARSDRDRRARSIMMDQPQQDVTTSRKAISKRLRHEIMRRDNYTCRYCGATSADGKLTIDHVTPVALGGTDEPANLVTACADCNAGKSSTQPDAPLVEDVAQTALRWSRAMRDAAAAMAANRDDAQEYVDAFYAAWPQYRWLPLDAEPSVRNIYATGLPVRIMQEAVQIATTAPGIDNRFRYFMGICWKRVAHMQEIAVSLLALDEDA